MHRQKTTSKNDLDGFRAWNRVVHIHSHHARMGIGRGIPSSRLLLSRNTARAATRGALLVHSPRVHGMCHREVHQALFPRHHTCHTLPILLGGHHTWGILSLVEVQALPRVSLSTSDSNIHVYRCGLFPCARFRTGRAGFPAAFLRVGKNEST